jgi:hypothetical protein
MASRVDRRRAWSTSLPQRSRRRFLASRGRCRAWPRHPRPGFGGHAAASYLHPRVSDGEAARSPRKARAGSAGEGRPARSARRGAPQGAPQARKARARAALNVLPPRRCHRPPAQHRRLNRWRERSSAAPGENRLPGARARRGREAPVRLWRRRRRPKGRARAGRRPKSSAIDKDSFIMRRTAPPARGIVTRRAETPQGAR